MFHLYVIILGLLKQRIIILRSSQYNRISSFLQCILVVKIYHEFLNISSWKMVQRDIFLKCTLRENYSVKNEKSRYYLG